MSIEKISKLERKEEEPKNRHIEIHIFRHAEAEGEKRDANLTEKGKKQAQITAEDLLKEIAQTGGVIKIFHSPILRAKQTAENFEMAIEKLIKEKPIDFPGIRLSYKRRPREKLYGLGVYGKLKEKVEKGEISEEFIDYWLEHPETIEGKSPDIIAGRVLDLANKAEKISERLGGGEPIHYIFITHEMPLVALANKLSRKNLQELGGDIGNCEGGKIIFSDKSGEAPQFIFRDKKYSLSTKKE
jgi:broad specificity phosphatase PhoE